MTNSGGILELLKKHTLILPLARKALSASFHDASAGLRFDEIPIKEILSIYPKVGVRFQCHVERIISRISIH